MWQGSAWTQAHEAWLARQRFDQRALRVAYEESYASVLAIRARRDLLDQAIAVEATDPRWVMVVGRLACLRGVSTLTAFGLAVEIGEWERFTGRSIGAYLGLVPTESSSGDSRSQGSITKTGNGHARRLLIEAAWHHRPPYRIQRELRRRQDAASPAARDRAQRATGACTLAGPRSMPASSCRSSRTPRLPASWPAGAGRWPCSTTDLLPPKRPDTSHRW